MGKEFTDKNIIPGIAPENHGAHTYISYVYYHLFIKTGW